MADRSNYGDGAFPPGCELYAPRPVQDIHRLSTISEIARILATDHDADSESIDKTEVRCGTGCSVLLNSLYLEPELIWHISA